MIDPAKAKERQRRYRERQKAAGVKPRDGHKYNIPRQCAACGRSFFISSTIANKGGNHGKYCSLACRPQGHYPKGWAKPNGPWRTSDSRRRNVYESLRRKQGDRCAICKQLARPSLGDVPGVYLVVDHDHATDQTRGLLCRPCNSALGMLSENLTTFRAAIRYLQSFKRLDRRSDPQLVLIQGRPT